MLIAQPESAERPGTQPEAPSHCGRPPEIAGYPGLQSRHPCCQNMQRLGQELCRLLSWRRRKKSKYPNFSGGVCKRQPLYIQGRWKRAKSFETMSRAQCTTEERKALCKTLHLKGPEARNSADLTESAAVQIAILTPVSPGQSGNGITHTSHHSSSFD